MNDTQDDMELVKRLDVNDVTDVAEVLKRECMAVFGATWSNDVAMRFARAVLTHLRAQNEDGLTARNTVASPISQEGSIEAAPLSDGESND